MSPVVVAAGQIRSVHGEVDANVELVMDTMRNASEQGVQLLVMPECGLTGYVYSSAAQVRSVAVSVDGPELRTIAELATELDLHVVVGLLERSGDAVYNTAVLLTPGGARVAYRKTHLPTLGADRFVVPGDNEPIVVETELGRLGLSICYDLRFPEWARALALDGTDVIVNPTNWPVPAQRVAELFTRVRAAENHVFIVVANRGDEEEGVPYIGCSQILDPNGSVLAYCERGEQILTAEIDPLRAREKDIASPEDEFAIDLFSDRRPALYGALVRESNGQGETQQLRSAEDVRT